MSTRSLIALDNDSVYTAVYTHYDGYLTCNGRILLESYTDIEKVDALLELGSFPQLLPDVAEIKPYNDYPAQDFDSLQELIDYFMGSDCEYLYMFNGRGWEYMTKKMKQMLLLVPSDVYPKKVA